MYFCPCPCNDPIDPDTEENTLFTLPRNLSYVQESYLDRYSVSARFVHNPKIERSIQREQNQENRANVEDETARLLSAVRAQDFPVRTCAASFESDKNPFFSSLSLTTTAAILGATSPASAAAVDESSSSSGTLLCAGPSSLDTSKVTSATSSTSSSSSSPVLFVASSVLTPATRFASKLSALLHSPPNESMDSARDGGSSVDANDLSELTSRLASADSSQVSSLECPENLGEVMDRGEEEEGVSTPEFFPERRSGRSDVHSGEEVADERIDSVEDDDGDKEQGGNNVSEMDIAPDTLLIRPYGIGGKTHFPRCDLGSTDVVVGTRKKTSIGSTASYESPDSDAFSEEGVFVTMDDLDSNNEKSATVSEVSDDTCVSADSMFLSPEEGELEEEEVKEPARKMTLQEAISRAAMDLSKMSMEMYGSLHSPQSEEVDDDDEKEDEISKRSRLALATVGRSSPVRGTSGLKLHISDPDIAGSDQHLSSSSTLVSDSPVYPENEFNFSRQELRKSSSLKTNKTPPGTPHRKKVVRFADAMGLDLESVRHVLNMESPPRIPASAMADLQAGLNEDRKEVGSRYLCPCFNQPGAADTFVQRVLAQKVSLENAIITDLTITGFVRVSNVAFHKSVRVRYTHNSWATFHDIAATYVQNSCDGPTDRFSFSIVAPAYFVPGNRLEFAVSFNAGGVEYWDNNGGSNYVFECFAKTVPTESETAWLHFL